jgi:hypothetical protein
MENRHWVELNKHHYHRNNREKYEHAFPLYRR